MQAYNELLPQLEPQQPGGHHRRRQPDRYAKALEIASNDKNSDGMLVILTRRP
jgi:hypothetical protein